MTALANARPVTASELGGILRDAHDRHARVRIAGRGTWAGRSAAVAPDAAVLDVSALTGILE